jgi:hypothetical protein
MIWVALVMVLGQGIIIGTLLYFVRTFGAYTEALLRTHESNITIHEHTVRLIDELRAARQEKVVLAAREVA